MTSLSDFPPDVQAAASAEALKFVEWLIPAPHDYSGSEDVLAKVIASAIMADRATRPAPRIGGLTAHQKRVLEYLSSYIAQHGIAPSYEEIRAHLGLVSKSSVHRVIGELEERGAIQRIPGRSRAITIISTPAS